MIKKTFVKRRALFVVVSTILALVLIEGAARVGSHLYWSRRYASLTRASETARLQYDANLGWTWADSERFRGKADVKKEKTPNVYRVIAVGDSCTRGAGVHPFETFSWKLEHLLNESKPPLAVEVLNAGVNGYLTAQMADYLERDLLSYSPDLVIVYANPFDGSDRVIDEGKTVKGSEMKRREPSAAAEALQGFLFRFKTYYLLQKAAASLRNETRGPIDAESSRESANLRRLRALCDGAGCRMMIVEYVVKKFDERGDYLFTPAFYKNRKWEAEFISVLDVMKESPYRPEQLFHDAVHATPLGHSLIAREITGRVLKEGLIVSAWNKRNNS